MKALARRRQEEPRRPLRIRRRMALITAVSTGAVVLAFCLPLAIFVRNVTSDRAVDGAALSARELAAELSAVTSPAAVASLTRQATRTSRRPVTVILAGGARLGAPLSGAVGLPPGFQNERDLTTVTADGGRLVWEPVHGGTPAIAVVARVSPDLLTRGVAGIWALLFAGGALLVLLAVWIADRLGRSIVRPLTGLVTVTRRLRDGDLACRDDPSGPYEVAEVGQAVNELADRIESLLASGRLAAADLGHRLRTPLTVLRLHAEEVSDPAARRRLRQDIETLEEAVSHLIRQTRDAPPEVPAPADLAEAVRDRMAFWSVLARSQDRRAVISLPDCRADVAIGRDELDAAIDALLSNVFIHTPPQTGFRVSLDRRVSPERPWRGQAAWHLVVENSAPALALAATAPAAPGTLAGPAAQAPAATPGSAEFAVPAMAMPRPARNRGTGLGLDIVRRTASGAGGTVTAGASASGGFRVEIRIPERPARGG